MILISLLVILTSFLLSQGTGALYMYVKHRQYVCEASTYAVSFFGMFACKRSMYIIHCSPLKKTEGRGEKCCLFVVCGGGWVIFNVVEV